MDGLIEEAHLKNRIKNKQKHDETTPEFRKNRAIPHRSFLFFHLKEVILLPHSLLVDLSSRGISPAKSGER